MSDTPKRPPCWIVSRWRDDKLWFGIFDDEAKARTYADTNLGVSLEKIPSEEELAATRKLLTTLAAEHQSRGLPRNSKRWCQRRDEFKRLGVWPEG